MKPGSFLVGECWKGLGQIAEYYQSGIDSFFLFPASQAEGYIAASMRARRPAETYVKNLKRVSDALGDSLLTPFLSNHDTGRTVGLVQGRQAPDRVKFAHALIALMGGANKAIALSRKIPDAKVYFILDDGKDGYEIYCSPAMQEMMIPE